MLEARYIWSYDYHKKITKFQKYCCMKKHMQMRKLGMWKLFCNFHWISAVERVTLAAIDAKIIYVQALA